MSAIARPDRLWLPSDLMDETVPELRASPSDWIVRLDDGAPALQLGDPDDDGAQPPRLLKDGETVDFMWFEDHGEAWLTIAADGTWHVDRPQPSEANVVRVDYEWIDDTLAAVVADIIADLRDDLVGGEPLLVQYVTWSEPEPFVFDAKACAFVPAPEVAG